MGPSGSKEKDGWLVNQDKRRGKEVHTTPNASAGKKRSSRNGREERKQRGEDEKSQRYHRGRRG